MSVADLDSDPSHASAGESDADDTEKLLLQSMLNQEQIYSKKDLFDTKSMHSAVSKMPSVVSVEHSSNQSTGYQTPDRTYALKALRSSAGLLVEPSTESTRKIKEDLSEKYLKELLDSLLQVRMVRIDHVVGIHIRRVVLFIFRAFKLLVRENGRGHIILDERRVLTFQETASRRRKRALIEFLGHLRHVFRGIVRQENRSVDRGHHIRELHS